MLENVNEACYKIISDNMSTFISELKILLQREEGNDIKENVWQKTLMGVIWRLREVPLMFQKVNSSLPDYINEEELI
jgi:hypothetical protein